MEKKEKNRNSYSELPEGEETPPAKAAKKESRKGKENREIRILKKGKSVKEKNNPDRFNGDGINFRAKIIGIEDVFDARGNRMCQGALQKLKAAVKTSGDHKKRIILNISLNGIIIKDEKSGEMLHHHPIHKISCISQDTKDNRAFGFVYGCPQTGHRFFAIKTEKAASQVVVTLRDLFLVALEIKKKEIEKTVDTQKENGDREIKTEDSENGLSNGNTSTLDCIPAEFENSDIQRINHDLLYSNTVLLPEEDITTEKCEINHVESEAAGDSLLDLQSEVSILQQGISQMDQSIAHAVSQSVGISFSEDEISESSTSSIPTSFQFKLDKLSSLYHETMSISSRSSSTSDYNVCVTESKQEDSDTPRKDPFRNSASVASEGWSSGLSSVSVGGSGSTSELSNINSAATSVVEDKYAVFLDIDSLPSIFDNPNIVKMPEDVVKASDTIQHSTPEAEEAEVKSSVPVAFSELDPLGNQPYVDKRDFFHDIKNPPKKVLKDLVDANVSGGSESEAASNSPEHLGFSDLKCNHPEDSSIPGGTAPLSNSPKLAIKTLVPFLFPTASETVLESDFSNDSAWEPKNPFNPFMNEDYPDMPPPISPPPPPPPRLPMKTSESSPSMTPPPPRPPSRVNGIPTPPLPKRKVPLNSTNRTWFSFDQDAVSFSAVPLTAEPDVSANHIAPPLPSPARKLPLHKPESPLLKSSSASNSPATLRRLYNRSPYLYSTDIIKEDSDTYSPYLENGLAKECKDSKTNIVTSSPHTMLSRHSSIAQDGDVFSGATFNPFVDDETQTLAKSHEISCSPPLPPKPMFVISQSRPSPIKKIDSAPGTSSFSSSCVSVTESSNGTHSSSSLVFSSLDDNKIGSSSEALFTNSTNSQSDVFTQTSSQETIQPQSSNSVVEEKPMKSDLSPDSIFHRKSDPFADDFFLSLHKKSNCDTQSITKISSTSVEVPFEDIKAPTQ